MFVRFLLDIIYLALMFSLLGCCETLFISSWFTLNISRLKQVYQRFEIYYFWKKITKNFNSWADASAKLVFSEGDNKLLIISKTLGFARMGTWNLEDCVAPGKVCSKRSE